MEFKTIGLNEITQGVSLFQMHNVITMSDIWMYMGNESEEAAVDQIRVLDLFQSGLGWIL